MSTTSTSKRRTCFMIAEHGPRIEELRRRLEARDVTCYASNQELQIHSLDISVQSLIQRSDFVAGIVSSRPSVNAAFELGLAIGLGKPLLLFTSDPTSPPLDMTPIKVLSTDLLSSSGWSDYLDAFLMTVAPPMKREHRKSRSKGARRAAAAKWDKIVAETALVTQPHGTDAAMQFERIVERAFKQAGFVPVSSPRPDYGADFALASPVLKFMRQAGLVL